MAKEKMICPFLKELCRECPLYKGRHYYLCYCSRYRGRLENSSNRVEKGPAGVDVNQYKNFEMPPVLEPSPSWLILNDFVEGNKRGEDKGGEK